MNWLQTLLIVFINTLYIHSTGLVDFETFWMVLVKDNVGVHCLWMIYVLVHFLCMIYVLLNFHALWMFNVHRTFLSYVTFLCSCSLKVNYKQSPFILSFLFLSSFFCDKTKVTDCYQPSLYGKRSHWFSYYLYEKVFVYLHNLCKITDLFAPYTLWFS
jgi:hypothetical protein